MSLRAFSVQFLHGLKKLGYVTIGRKADSETAAQVHARRLRQVSRRMLLAQEQRPDPLLEQKLESVQNGV